MIDLTGQVAIVTGSSRGIGRACALRLAECGADVVVNFRSSEAGAKEVAAAVRALGRQALAVRADVSEQEDVKAMVDAVVDRFGRLDIIVSNAAAGGFRPASEITPAHLNAIINANAAPLVWLAQAATDAMASSETGGRIVAISSHGSQWAVHNYAAIGASKATLESLMRHLVLELGPKGININTVLPGVVATEAVQTMPDIAGVIKSAGERMLTRKRHIDPADVANIVAFLASPQAQLIQGQTIVVDGGITIQV